MEHNQIDDSNNTIDQSSPCQSYIDNITLQYFSNKAYHNKCNSNNDTTKHKDEEYLRNITTNKYRISNLIKKYIDNPEHKLNSNIDTAIENLFKSCIQHFELLDNNSNQDQSVNNNYYCNDDDVMFEFIDDVSETKSYWGKSIHKI